MEFRFKKLLTVASVINIIIGILLIGFGSAEFLGWKNTSTTITTVGMQLSNLIFISGVFVFLTGALSILNNKTMSLINYQTIMGIVALAWPIFVTVALFFSRRYICIRLLPTILSALFYVITILIVRLTNEQFVMVHKFNPYKSLIVGKRKTGINVGAILTSAAAAKSTGDIINEEKSSKKPRTANAGAIISKSLQGTKRRASGNIFAFFQFGGRRRSGGGLFKRLYARGRVRRRGFAFRRRR